MWCVCVYVCVRLWRKLFSNSSAEKKNRRITPSVMVLLVIMGLVMVILVIMWLVLVIMVTGPCWSLLVIGRLLWWLVKTKINPNGICPKTHYIKPILMILMVKSRFPHEKNTSKHYSVAKLSYNIYYSIYNTLTSATAYCSIINYSELINCNKYCSIQVFTLCSSCRQLGTVLGKVI